GFYSEIEGEGAAELRHLGIDDRPGPDEAHIPAKNVPQLRQSIQAAPTQEGANPRYPRIVFQLVSSIPFLPQIRVFRQITFQQLLTIHCHRAEFPQEEVPVSLANTALLEEHGTTGIQYDGNGDHHSKW